MINVDLAHVHRPEEFEFVDNVFELADTANGSDYLLVVVTNHAGLGRGDSGEAQFQELTDWMKTKFREFGGIIDAVYFCPYHPEHGIDAYRQESDFRKPAPGVLLKAQRGRDIELDKSILLVTSRAIWLLAALLVSVHCCS